MTAAKLLPILRVMPWMSWATSSCPEAIRAFSWLRRWRLSLSELSICSWPSYSFPCWVCRALCPSSNLSSEAEVSSFSSSWPSCETKAETGDDAGQLPQYRFEHKPWWPLYFSCICTWPPAVHPWTGARDLPSGPSLRLVGLLPWRWEHWPCARLCVETAAAGPSSRRSAPCCWWCGRRSTCLNPCRPCTLWGSVWSMANHASERCGGSFSLLPFCLPCPPCTGRSGAPRSPPDSWTGSLQVLRAAPLTGCHSWL